MEGNTYCICFNVYVSICVYIRVCVYIYIHLHSHTASGLSSVPTSPAVTRPFLSFSNKLWVQFWGISWHLCRSTLPLITDFQTPCTSSGKHKMTRHWILNLSVVSLTGGSCHSWLVKEGSAVIRYDLVLGATPSSVFENYPWSWMTLVSYLAPVACPDSDSFLLCLSFTPYKTGINKHCTWNFLRAAKKAA